MRSVMLFQNWLWHRVTETWETHVLRSFPMLTGQRPRQTQEWDNKWDNRGGECPPSLGNQGLRDFSIEKYGLKAARRAPQFSKRWYLFGIYYKSPESSDFRGFFVLISLVFVCLPMDNFDPFWGVFATFWWVKFGAKPCQAPVFEGIWDNFWGKIQLCYRSFLKGSSGQNQDVLS